MTKMEKLLMIIMKTVIMKTVIVKIVTVIAKIVTVKDSDNEDNDSEDSDNDDSEDSDSKDSDSGGSDSEDYDSNDSSNDRGEAPSDDNINREDEDAKAFNEENSYKGVDYYDEDIEDDEEAIEGDYDEYPYGRPSDWSFIINVSPKSSPRYDKYHHEILELGSFHNSEFGSKFPSLSSSRLSTFTDEEDDID